MRLNQEKNVPVLTFYIKNRGILPSLYNMYIDFAVLAGVKFLRS